MCKSNPISTKFDIRNSTAEFLIFLIEGKEDVVQVVYHNGSVWCTQKAMAQLFDVGMPAISKHLNNIFAKGELRPDSTVSKYNRGNEKCNFAKRKVHFLRFSYLSSAFVSPTFKRQLKAA